MSGCSLTWSEDETTGANGLTNIGMQDVGPGLFISLISLLPMYDQLSLEVYELPAELLYYLKKTRMFDEHNHQLNSSVGTNIATDCGFNLSIWIISSRDVNFWILHYDKKFVKCIGNKLSLIWCVPCPTGSSGKLLLDRDTWPLMYNQNIAKKAKGSWQDPRSFNKSKNGTRMP